MKYYLCENKNGSVILIKEIFVDEFRSGMKFMEEFIYNKTGCI